MLQYLSQSCLFIYTCLKIVLFYPKQLLRVFLHQMMLILKFLKALQRYVTRLDFPYIILMLQLHQYPLYSVCKAAETYIDQSVNQSNRFNSWFELRNFELVSEIKRYLVIRVCLLAVTLSFNINYLQKLFLPQPLSWRAFFGDASGVPPSKFRISLSSCGSIMS